MNNQVFTIGDSALNTAVFLGICDGRIGVRLGSQARAKVKECLEFRRRLEQGTELIYGVNTGFGKLADTVIKPHQLATLQTNLIRSHAVGWGPPLTRREVRGMLLLRAVGLAAGNSGVRPELIEQLLWLLENDIIPWIPSRGSVGASGDLAPLAHLALVLMGEGHVLDDRSTPIAAGPVLAAHGRAPLTLEAKEGLALINGTQLMVGLGLLAVADIHRLLANALLAAALSVEALEASARPFTAQYHALRPHPEIVEAASILDALLRGSEIQARHRDCGRVQDPYSVRCAPQVLGASLGQVRRAEQVFLLEAGAVTDNPVLIPATGEVITGGHFHGQPLALQLDALYAACAEVGNIAERRINLLLSGNGGRLPRFLAADPGLESGMMIAQYLAAALVCETRNLAFPAAVDSIPTSDGQEDHVSMGSVAALKLAGCLDRCEAVVALEMMTAARAIELLERSPAFRASGMPAPRPAAPLGEVLTRLRSSIDLTPQDRPLSEDLATVCGLLRHGHLLAGSTAAALGPLLFNPS